MQRALRSAPDHVRRRVVGRRPGGPVASGHLAFTSFGEYDADRLRALVHNLFTHEPDARLLVIDDCTGDDVRDIERDGRVDVVRRWRPAGYPTGLVRILLQAYSIAARRYRFDVLLKIDTDALLLRPGVFAQARESFAERPELGMLGTHIPDASVESDTHRWSWLVPLLERQAAQDRVLGGLLRRAHANGYRLGEHVQGGVHVLSPGAIAGLEAAGVTRWRPPRSELFYDDIMMSMFVRAVGFGLGDLDGPHASIRSTATTLPLPLDELARSRVTAVHSVKRGLDGEREDEVRARLARLDD